MDFNERCHAFRGPAHDTARRNAGPRPAGRRHCAGFPGSDYRFRAVLPEAEVADAVSKRLLDISYGNFKASVREPKRHDAYFKVWDVMHDLQEAAR